MITKLMEMMPTATPEFVKKHQGRGMWEVFEEMMHDAHIQSVFRSRRAGVAGRVWGIVPADGASRSHKIAQFVRKTLAAVPNFEYVLAHLLKAIPYGHSVAEIMWRIDGDAIRVDAVRTRRPERFIIRDSGELRLFDPDTTESRHVPKRKFILHENENQDGIFPRAILWSLYWPWYFKKHSHEIHHAYEHVFGDTTKFPPKHFTDTKVKKLIDQIFHWEGLNEGQPVNPIFCRNLLDTMNAEISKTVLGDAHAQEIGSAGSYAAARTHQEVRQEIIEADARLLQTTVNATLVRWLVDFNYGPQVEAPRFVVDCLPSRGTAEFAQTLRTLSEMGYVSPKHFKLRENSNGK